MPYVFAGKLYLRAVPRVFNEFFPFVEPMCGSAEARDFRWQYASLPGICGDDGMDLSILKYRVTNVRI